MLSAAPPGPAAVPRSPAARQRTRLYTAEQRKRRDATRWTLVQGLLAPVQFFVFLVSLVLVLRFLATGHGETAAVVSVLAKTSLLYAIMVTGCIWEKVVFGCYLSAWLFGWLTVNQQMWLALAAYASYAINATQFILKLRAARLDMQAGTA